MHLIYNLKFQVEKSSRVTDSVQHIQLDSSASSASYLHNIHFLYKLYEQNNFPI